MSILGQFQFRRDLASAWSTVNPILLDGELGIESDTDLFKIGDGVTAWNLLPYGGLRGLQGEQGIQGIQGIQGEQGIQGIQGEQGLKGDTGNTGAAGNNGWSPLLASEVDGERRVLKVVDYIGGTGTKPTVPTNNYIGTIGFTDLANAVDFRGATGATGATGAAANAFTNIAVTGQTTVSAEQASDTLTLVGAGSITITTDPVTDSIVFTGTATAPVNTFGTVTGNSGAATADTPADTLAITGGTGIDTTATDTPDGLVITNTDTGSSAISAHVSDANPHPQYTTDAEATAIANSAVGTHEAASDPHPQYLTQAEGDTRYAAAGAGGSPKIIKKLTATQANSTVTPADITQLVTALEANSVYRIECFITFQAAATTTGLALGFTSVAGTKNQIEVVVPLSSGAIANAVRKTFPNATETVTGEVLGTGVTAVNSDHTARMSGLIHTTSAGNWTPRFRSEVAGSAVTLQVGSSIVLEKIA